MYYKPEQETQIKLTITIDGVQCPYIYSNLEPFKHKSSELYAGYSSIHSDLIHALKLLQDYYGKFNDPILDETLWKQSILLIGRTFSIGEGRGTSLNTKNFKSNNDFFKFLEEVINIRNTYVAHHGFTEMSWFLTVIGLSDPKKSKSIACVGEASIQQSSPSPEEVDNLKSLLIGLIKWTESKKKKLEQKIMDDFSKMNLDDLYEKSIKP